MLASLIRRFRLRINLIRLLIGLIKARCDLLNIRSSIRRAILLLMLLRINVITNRLYESLYRSTISRIFYTLLCLILISIYLVIMNVGRAIRRIGTSFSTLVIRNRLRNIDHLLNLIRNRALRMFLEDLREEGRLRLRLDAFLRLVSEILYRNRYAHLNSSLYQGFNRNFISFMEDLLRNFYVSELRVLALCIMSTSLADSNRLRQDVRLLRTNNIRIRICFLLNVSRHVCRRTTILMLDMRLRILSNLLCRGT